MINRSAPSGTIIPTLFYDDIAQAIAWLCDVFGFTERLRAGDSHAQLAFGKGGRNALEIPYRRNHRVPPSPRLRRHQDFLVRVDDVDRHFEHTRQSNARIILPPETYSYGERQYSVEDFAGTAGHSPKPLPTSTPQRGRRFKSQSK